MSYRNVSVVLVVLFLATIFVACAPAAPQAAPTTAPQAAPTAAPAAPAEQPKAMRTYYMVSSHQAHPYFADSHLSLRYAAEYFKVNIIAAGPEGWDTKAQADAIEVATAKKADGIITRMWDDSPAEAVKKAMAAGIPVVMTETRTAVNPGLTYIGLDNYQCGRDTAAELIKRAGTTGKVALMGNWGAANTDAKLKGVKDFLAENSKWEVVVEADDKAATADAIEAAKSIFNNYPDVNAVVGLDSSSGTGIATAMQELNIKPGSVKVVVHDREPATLEFIDKGYIDATLINKTATDEYMGILLMEDWNNGGLKNIPISSDNAAAGVNPIPENMYNTAAVIDKTNVKYFIAANMPQITSDLYNH
jgi:ribose transport system substrate-binding protein